MECGDSTTAQLRCSSPSPRIRNNPEPGGVRPRKHTWRRHMADADSGISGAFFDDRPNLSMTERALYVAIGLGLAAAAAKPRPNPLLNVLALAGGSYLAWR